MVKLKYLFQIMLAMGNPLREIHVFADIKHWLAVSLDLCQRDLTNFGKRIDWRRARDYVFGLRELSDDLETTCDIPSETLTIMRHASRIALTDVGDGVADANFEGTSPTTASFVRTTYVNGAEGIVTDQDQLQHGDFNGFQDALFDNEMNLLVVEAQKHFEATNSKASLKAGFFEFINARGFYRETCNSANIKHKDLARRYIELQSILLCVIAPYWSEILKKYNSIQYACYATAPATDAVLAQCESTSMAQQTASTPRKRSSRGRRSPTKLHSTTKPKKLIVFVAGSFPHCQEKYIDPGQSAWEAISRSVRDVKTLNRRIAQMALGRKLALDEASALSQMALGLKTTAGVSAIDLVLVDDDGKHGVDGGGLAGMEELPVQARAAVPGEPTFAFQNT
ncbi:cytosolic leucyl tRNA synthetase [Conoideocrella luteorostrata]|uniref:Cytosolic leucyl tRNA synthetase n=1 Tax=Conoideocrella luteorostrata TaxID=1105319 RepID=A0AAJ0CRG3_9HYPO|nr:cytosolic leucyl tRNA synthetase [Conoideocrella luteorostrata]